MDSVIDSLAKQEYRDGVSAGAAVRQLCRSLQSAPNLKRLLEDLLADGNRQAHEIWEQKELTRKVLASVPKQ